MPVKFTQKLWGKDINGDTVYLTGQDIESVTRAKTEKGGYALLKREEQVQSSTDVSVICDNPKCPAPQTFNWNQEKAGENPDEVPDGMFRTIGIKLFDQTEKIFCCKSCAVHFLDGMAPLRSPREARLVDKVFPISDATGFNGGGDE